MTQIIALVAFPLMMAYAASSDLLTMTIPNLLSLLLVTAYLALAVLVGQTWQAMGFNVLCGLGMLSLTFAMFCFGWIGGGDAKLAAATAVWFGWPDVVQYTLVAAIFGGALTLLILLLRRWPLPSSLMRQAWIARLHDPQSGVPYGVALAAAGLCLYPETALWVAATNN
jgi:prepilin peptidase CpaA